MGEHVNGYGDAVLGYYRNRSCFLTKDGFQQLSPGVEPLILPAGTVITPELLANPMTLGAVAPQSSITFEDVCVSRRQVESAGNPDDAAFLRSIGVAP